MDGIDYCVAMDICCVPYTSVGEVVDRGKLGEN